MNGRHAGSKQAETNARLPARIWQGRQGAGGAGGYNHHHHHHTTKTPKQKPITGKVVVGGTTRTAGRWGWVVGLGH